MITSDELPEGFFAAMEVVAGGVISFLAGDAIFEANDFSAFCWNFSKRVINRWAFLSDFFSEGSA